MFEKLVKTSAICFKWKAFTKEEEQSFHKFIEDFAKSGMKVTGYEEMSLKGWACLIFLPMNEAETYCAIDLLPRLFEYYKLNPNKVKLYISESEAEGAEEMEEDFWE